MSHTLAMPLDDAWQKSAQSDGWNSAAVMTSVRSSMHAGFMSTRTYGAEEDELERAAELEGESAPPTEK